MLFEADHKDGFMHGFTDNYIKVKTPYNKALINQLRTVTLKEIDEKGEVVAEIIEEEALVLN